MKITKRADGIVTLLRLPALICADCPIRPTNPQSCALKRPCGALAVRRVNCA